jgi:nitroimidazol reductase NimA-like FMN-containing flavoprotein (pyridoxamine 5'-phosphate oxidase superfamily)
MNESNDVGRPAEIFQLDRSTCLALLAAQHVGRLVVVGDAASPVAVVNYTVHDESIVFRSDPGRRVASIVDTDVVFEADMYDPRTRSGWSVVVRGKAQDVSAAAPGRAVAVVDTWAPGPKSCWISIALTEVTGRLLRGEVQPPWVHPDAYL